MSRSFIALVFFLSVLSLVRPELEVPGNGNGNSVDVEHPKVTSLVSCSTTKGNILLEIYRDWSPLGADHFLELVKDGFFTDIALFRSTPKFLTQFGISDKPEKKHWHNSNIQDDPNLHIPIKKNYLSYAGGGANTRSTQLFIAYDDLDFLGKEPWETPFGKVVKGQKTVDSWFRGYGDIPPFGKGPDQQKLHNQGNAYIHKNFPKTDFILSCQEVNAEEAAAFAEGAPAVESELGAEATEEQEENEQAPNEEEENGEGREGEEEAGNGQEVPDGRSELHAAAADGDLEAIEEMLEQTEDSDILHLRDENGWQAIHEAARGGYYDILKYLLSQGADLGATTNEGDTILSLAREFGHDDVVEYLVEIGAPEKEE